MNGKHQKGVILILAFMILIAMISIVGTYIFTTSVVTKSTGFGEVGGKAFWLAEAGVSKAIWNIMTPPGQGGQGSGWTTAGTTESLGDGTYTMVVTRSGNTRTITSTGTIGNISRSLQVQITVRPKWPNAFDYAIFGDTNGNQLRLRDNVVISGDLYYDGNVQVDAGASVTNGLVYAGTVTGAGTYTEAPGNPNPIPTYPAFVATTYDAEITTAVGSATSNLTLSTGQTLNLTGTVYYKTVTIKNNATVTGTGTIVATEAILIRDTANIGQNIAFLGKEDITIKHSAVLQSGAIVYSQKDLTVTDSASVTGSLLAPKNNRQVIVNSTASVTGTIYGDIVRLGGSATVTGSVVADEYDGNRITDNVAATFNSDSLPWTLPTGMPENGATVTQISDSWSET